MAVYWSSWFHPPSGKKKLISAALSALFLAYCCEWLKLLFANITGP